jgi:DDE superfamily endonuclease
MIDQLVKLLSILPFKMAHASMSVLLGATMDGAKLTPFIIYVGKRNCRIISSCYRQGTEFPANCHYAAQKNGWMDAATFQKWIERVWRPFCIGKPKTLLLMDCFSVHVMPTMIEELEQCGTKVIFIPKGYTCQLQVLDVGINKPFKHYLQMYHRNFRVHHENEKPGHLDMAQWIVLANDAITQVNVTNTWRHVGITHPELNPNKNAAKVLRQ